MMRKKLFRKMYTSAMLVAFCAVILVSQVPGWKIQNPKFGKISLSKQSQGPNGSLTNEHQTSPIDNPEEEEDDDFKLESTLSRTHQLDFCVIKHYPFHEDLICDPHREIFSPPPQI